MCLAVLSEPAELAVDRNVLIDRTRAAFDVTPSTQLDAVDIGRFGSYVEFRISSKTVGRPFERDLFIDHVTGEIFELIGGLTIEKEAIREGRVATRWGCPLG